MDIIKRFWPWSEIARLKSDVAGYEAAYTTCRGEGIRQRAEIVSLNIELAKAGNEKSELRAQIAKFDGDGDGRIGGSRPGKSPPAGGSKKRGG